MKTPDIAMEMYEQAKAWAAPMVTGLTIGASVMGGVLAQSAEAANPAGGALGPQVAGTGGGAPAPETQPTVPLENVSQLPGFRLHIGKHEIGILSQATVTITERTVVDGNPSLEWFEECSGDKLSDGGGYGILTAAGCVNPADTPANLFVNLNKSGGVDSTDTLGNGISVEDAIVDPGSSAAARDASPIAIVDGMTLDTPSSTAALSTRAPGASDEKARDTRQRPLKNIPSIPLSALQPYRQPIAGELVALSGLAEPGGKPVSELGRFIGAYSASAADGLGIQGNVEIVGINPPSDSLDACAEASVGSAVETPAGSVLGVVSGSIGNGESSGPDGGASSSPAEDGELMQTVQTSLGVQLVGRYSTLCVVSTMPGSTPPPPAQAASFGK